MAIHDMSSLSPIDIGRGLGMSLESSCKFEDITAEDHSVLRAANIPAPQFFKELVALAGFAHDYAIVDSLGTTEIGRQVRDGYHEIWTRMGQQSPAHEMVLRLYIERCPAYATAVGRMQLGDPINEIALTFAGFLASDDVQILTLSITHAPATYFSHYEGTVLVLKQAKLLK